MVGGLSQAEEQIRRLKGQLDARKGAQARTAAANKELLAELKALDEERNKAVLQLRCELDRALANAEALSDSIGFLDSLDSDSGREDDQPRPLQLLL
jgi:hypothetical protein